MSNFKAIWILAGEVVANLNLSVDTFDKEGNFIGNVELNCQVEHTTQKLKESLHASIHMFSKTLQFENI